MNHTKLLRGAVHARIPFLFGVAGLCFTALPSHASQIFAPQNGSANQLPSLMTLASDVQEGTTSTATARVLVDLSAPSDKTVTVKYATVDGTAVSGADFTPTSGTLTFTPGMTIAEVLIPITSDDKEEDFEHFSFKLSDPVNATIRTPDAQITIIDDDIDLAVRVQDFSAGESSSDTVARVPVLLAKASTDTVTVHYTTKAGSATEGTDYVGVSGILTFPPGTTTQYIPITIKGDETPEVDEDFTVVLSDPTGATIRKATGLVTIINFRTGKYTVSGRCVSLRPDATFKGLSRSGVAAAKINLLNTEGNAIAGTVTDMYGNYVFTDVLPGTYTVTAILDREAQGTVSFDPPSRVIVKGDEDVTVDRFALYSVFGFVRAPNKTGEVVPVGGVTVKLINPNGVAVAARVTKADGKYEFGNQRKANFRVVAEPTSAVTFPEKAVSVPSTGSAWSPAVRANILGVRKTAGTEPSGGSF